MSNYAGRKARSAQLRNDAWHALETGDLDLVKKHLKAGRYDKASSRYDSRVQTRTNHFGSAAENGQIHIMDFLYEIEPTAHADSQCGYLLCRAAVGNQVEMINYFIEKGVSQLSKNSALVSAAWNDSTDAMKCLLDIGAQVDYKDQDAMCVSAIAQHCESLKLLVKYGADMNYDNDAIFLFCVNENKNKIVRTMLIDLNMVINSETHKWLDDNNHTETLQLIAKRELFNKLSQSLERRPQNTQFKEKKMKI